MDPTCIYCSISQESPEDVGAPLHHITPCRQCVETSLQFNHKQDPTSSFFRLPAATPSQVTFPWWPHWLRCSETAPNRWWRHKFLSWLHLAKHHFNSKWAQNSSQNIEGPMCFCLGFFQEKIGILTQGHNWTFLSWSRQSANWLHMHIFT